MVSGLISGSMFVLSLWLLYGLIPAILFGLIYGVAIGIGMLEKIEEEITPVEVLQWSCVRALIFMLLGSVMLIVELTLGLILGLTVWFNFGPAIGSIVCLSIILIQILIIIIASGLQRGEMKIKMQTNEGIWRSLINALVTGLLFGVLGLLSFGIIGVVNDGLWGDRLDSWLNLGLVGGFLLGMYFGGGLAFIKHFILRFIIYLNCYLPFRLVPFLDYCVDRIFLRKVGGGYIFIHRYLMEYFASLTPEDIERLANMDNPHGHANRAGTRPAPTKTNDM